MRTSRRSLLAGLATAGPAAAATRQGKRPNILLILADDLGFSDLGVTGGEIATPNLDALAGQGRLFTSMQGTGMPISKAVILTGGDTHQVGYGSMGPPSGRQIGRPGYERHLNDRAVTVAERLAEAGYFTCIAGSWGVGPAPTEDPSKRGFAKSYVLIEAAADYYYPEPRRISGTESITYRADGALAAPPDGYATDVYTDRTIAFLEANRASGRPFFAYAPYTAPHFPIQAPDEELAKQKGRYDAGYDAIRLARIQRQKRLGVTWNEMTPAVPVPESDGYKFWQNLTPEEKAVEARRMEVYAAAVTRLDANIGRLLAYLKRTGQYENTLIVFTAGNGAADTWRHRRKLEDVDNSVGNMGRRHSWISYSERWAEVSNAPLAQWKGRMTEGGLTVPTIMRLPGQKRGKGSTGMTVTHKDLVPTLLDAAGLPPAGASFQGRETAPLTGVSLLPFLRGEVERPHEPEAVFAAETGGEAYVRQNFWKAVRLIEAPSEGEARRQELALTAAGDLAGASRIRAAYPRVWKLYDLALDRGETRDLAKARPDVLEMLMTHYRAYVDRVGVTDP